LLEPIPLGERILRGRGPEFEELLETLGEAITIRDRNDVPIYANRAALELLGFSSLAELQGHGLRAVMDDYIVHDEDGNPVTMSDIPSVRLLRGETPEPLLLHSVNRQTGTARWELLKTAPLHDRDGQLVAAVTVIEDISAVKAAEVHTRILAESGRLLASSLDYQQTLRNVANLAVPEFADWCMVELVAGGSRRDQVVVAHRDSHQRDLAIRMRALEPPELSDRAAVTRVVRTGSSEFFFDVPDEHLIRVARSEEHLQFLRALAVRSAIVVPMHVGARTIGAMSFFTSESQRRFTREDVALAEQLGRRAAVAVENSRLHTTLTRVSETLAQSLRPSELPDVPGWEIAALYRPAGAEQRIEVGGDFYEVFETGGASLVLIGDVTGHGVAAATLTAMLRHGARFASRIEPAPAAILRRLDEELQQRPDSAMCTAMCARLHDGRIELSSAGHPPALLVTRAGTVTESPVPGPLLGAFKDSQWQQETVPVEPGQLVLLYTDGVTDASGDRERFGGDRLRRLLSEHAGSSPERLLEHLDRALEQFRGGQPTDDVAALALRPRSVEAASSS
jgi:PAS domain S-box-containing protein